MPEQIMLSERRFDLAEQKHNRWFAGVENSVSIDDVMNPEFWGHVARNLRPCDEIVVYPDSCEWRLHLHVVSVNRQGATVAKLAYNDFTTGDVVAGEDPTGLIAKWAGPIRMWEVVRKDDGSMVKSGVPTKEAAFDYIRDTERKVA